MSNRFQFSYGSSDDEPSTKILSSDDEDEHKQQKNNKNFFDDIDVTEKNSLKAKTIENTRLDNTKTQGYSNKNDDDIDEYDKPTKVNSNRTTLFIKSSLIDKDRDTSKENSRSSSLSKVTLNEGGTTLYSANSTIVPPPQIGALRYDPSKILIDSTRNRGASTISNSSTKDNESSKVEPTKVDLNINYLSDNANKQIVKQNIELKSELSKLTAEVKSLKLKMNDKLDCKTTISRFMLNQSYSFDIYKTKREKMQLLNEATSTHDGNVIFAVVNYLKNSLSTDIFYGILINNPVALNHYVFFLEQMNYFSELAQFYKFQGNSNEYASINYFKPILTNKKQDLNEKLQISHEYENKLTQAEQNLINNSMVYGPVKKQLSLLSIQKEILKNKSTFLRKDEIKQNAMDSLYGSSIGNTVSFCLKYNKQLSENPLYSIDNLKKEFDIQTKQFSIWFIKAMSEIGSWTELESFTKQRGIFNMVKTPPVSFETIVFIISKVRGPNEQIKKYVSQIENLDKKQTLAIKFKLTEVVIETYKAQRDRVGLINYRNSFREGSFDYILANKVLAENQVKWKN